jgi:hypothetical protein
MLRLLRLTSLATSLFGFAVSEDPTSASCSSNLVIEQENDHLHLMRPMLSNSVGDSSFSVATFWINLEDSTESEFVEF